MPRLDASFPPEPGPVGYWPAEDAVAKIAESGLAKVAAPFNIRMPDDYVQGVLEGEINDAQLPIILTILSFVNTARITRDCAQYMRERLLALFGRWKPDVSNPGYRRCLAMMAEILAVTGTLKDGEELIAEHAGKLAAQWPEVDIGADVFENHMEPHQAVSILIEMVLAFVRHRNEPLMDKV